jgi:hypothetical protein
MYVCSDIIFKHCRELLASFNKITVVPPQIGKLKRLRRLILNSNKIKHIPDDIGQLDMLEELVLSENNIEDIPVSLSLMSNLKVIKLANNRLKTIPYEIADILTLEEIDCSNNHHLESIPAKWRGDTDSVLFTCRVHRGMRFRVCTCGFWHTGGAVGAYMCVQSQCNSAFMFLIVQIMGSGLPR